MEIYKSFLSRQNIEFQVYEIGICFEYQGASFIVIDNEGDKQYLQLVMPNLYEVPSSVAEEYKVLEVLNKINCDTKVVKGIIMQLGDTKHVWLNIEMFLDDSPEIDSFFFRALNILHQSKHKFHSAF